MYINNPSLQADNMTYSFMIMFYQRPSPGLPADSYRTGYMALMSVPRYSRSTASGIEENIGSHSEG